MPAPAILHVDMDAFFASVAQLDNPELQGKPVIVGGHSTQRGVVASASYEARAYGVRSAMPLVQAMALCPHAIRVPVAMSRYREVNRQLQRIWERFAPAVEPVGFEEAYLDVSGTESLLGSPAKVAQDLRQAIAAETGLSASVGGGTSKLVAKMASKFCKPAGVCWIEPGTERQWLHDRDIALVPGIGPATQRRLRAMGVHTIGELAAFPADVMAARFGDHGLQLQAAAQGHDVRPVSPGDRAKSISAEETFDADSNDPEFLRRRILDLSCEVGYRLRQGGFSAATITAKVRLARGFETIERSITVPAPVQDDDALAQLAWERVLAAWERPQPVRLLGVRVSNFRPAVQLSLFDQPRPASEELSQALDRIRERFGYQAVTRGALMGTHRKA